MHLTIVDFLTQEFKLVMEVVKISINLHFIFKNLHLQILLPNDYDVYMCNGEC